MILSRPPGRGLHMYEGLMKLFQASFIARILSVGLDSLITV